MTKEENPQNTKLEMVSGTTGYRPEVITKRAGKIILYPVTENELKIIATGSDGEVWLNSFFFCLSAALSLTICTLTTDIESELEKGIFYSATVVFYLLSVICIIIWFNKRYINKKLLKDILERDDIS